MTFSYTANPAGVTRDALRLLCGDTNAAQVLLQDEEYDFIQIQWPDEVSNYKLAAYGCEIIAGKFAREIDFSADSQTVGANVLQEKYLRLAERLRTQADAANPGELFVGGMDPWFGFDPTVKPLDFGTGMHDNPQAGSQAYGSRDHNPVYYDGYER